MIICPSRITVTRSDIWNISAIRWEMNTTATPRSFSRRVMSNSVRVSVSVSELVGSSIIIRRALKESARATSTICFCAVDSLPISVRVSRLSFTSSRSVRASRWVRWRSTSPFFPTFSRPTNRFSAMFRLLRTLSSWYMMEMPMRWDARGPEMVMGFPSKKISPSSMVYTPERIFISVDFPAPFSPTRASTSPG